MRGLLIAFSVIALAGCVNPYAYREDQKIQASFTTAKPASETQQCILAEWQKEPLLMQITQQQTGKYYSVVSTSDNADIHSENGVTRVNYYSLRGSLDVMSGKKKRISAIQSCL